MPSDTAERVKVYVHRDSMGYLLAVSSDRSDISPIGDDTVTEQNVWIEASA